MHLFSKNVDCNWIKRRLHRTCFLTIFGKSFASGFIFYFYYSFYYVYYFFMSLSHYHFFHLSSFSFFMSLISFLLDLCYFFDMGTYIISSFITMTVSKQAFSSHIWDSKDTRFSCDWLSFTHLLFWQKKCVIGFWYSLKWYLNWQVVNDWFTNLWA